MRTIPKSILVMAMSFLFQGCVDEPPSEGEGEGEGEGENGEGEGESVCPLNTFEGECSFPVCGNDDIGERISHKIRELNGPCINNSDCVWIQDDVRCAADGPQIAGGCGGVILVEHQCAWDQFFAELVTEVCEVCAFDGCTTSGGGCGDASAACIEGICQ